jgi:hypothetical protein
MNVLDIANAGLAGFLVSMMILDCLRPVIGARWPVQAEGLQFERRLLPWALAVITGPALLWDQSKPYRTRRAGTLADVAVLMPLVAVWSASYGVTLSWLVTALV